MSARLPNWRSALSAYFEKVRATAFVYGKSDCACFVAGAVEAMTGVDPMADIRGRYATVIGAKRFLKSAGASSLADFVARSFEEVHPAYARCGDLGVIKTDGPFGAALGVVSGERVMALTENGLDSVDRSTMQRAFTV